MNLKLSTGTDRLEQHQQFKLGRQSVPGWRRYVRQYNLLDLTGGDARTKFPHERLHGMIRKVLCIDNKLNRLNGNGRINIDHTINKSFQRLVSNLSLAKSVNQRVFHQTTTLPIRLQINALASVASYLQCQMEHPILLHYIIIT